MPPRNPTFITTRRDRIAVTAWTRQLVPGGSGIVPSIRFDAGSPVSKRWISSHPVEVSGTTQVPEPCGCSTAHRSAQAPPPVAALPSVSIASAATVEWGSRSVLSSKLTWSCPPETDRRSAARSAELMSAVYRTLPSVRESVPVEPAFGSPAIAP
jgi:hypothetical protein